MYIFLNRGCRLICGSGRLTFYRVLIFTREVDYDCVMRGKSKDNLENLFYVKG